MKRRELLSIVGLGAGISVSTAAVGAMIGDNSTSSDEMELSIESVEIPAGGSKELKITGENISSLRIIGNRSQGEGISIKYSDASITPSPVATWDGYPPTWEWNQKGQISISLPISAGKDTKAGAYEYSAIVMGVPGNKKEIIPFEIIINNS